MPSRRLEDRIRELCAKAVATPETELNAILPELKAALHEHIERLRKLGGVKLAGAENGKPQDRRSA